MDQADGVISTPPENTPLLPANNRAAGAATESTCELFPGASESTSQAAGTNQAPARFEPARLSRRSVVATLAAALAPAAGTVLVVPKVVAVAASAVGADHRYAALLEMGRRYDELSIAQAAADEHFQACSEACRQPEPPVELRHRIEDHLCGLSLPIIDTCGGGINHVPSRNDLYSASEVRLLRHVPPAVGDDAVEQMARIEEIERAWQAWQEALATADDEAGVGRAEALVDRLVDERRTLAKRIAATPAATLTGLRAHALILEDILSDFEEDDDATTDELMYRAMVRDILNITS